MSAASVSLNAFSHDFSSSLTSVQNEVGVQQPLGFWDPLGLLADGDKAKFERLRYVELKHGRISSTLARRGRRRWHSKRLIFSHSYHCH